MMTEQFVSVSDLDERININLEKDKLNYEDIIRDTRSLIGMLKMSMARQTLQVEIYERLIQRVRQRMSQEG